MNFLHQNPFVRISSAYMAGILLSDFFLLELSAFALLVILLASLLILKLLSKPSFQHSYLFGFWFFLVLLFLGIARTKIENPKTEKVSHQIKGLESVKGLILEQPREFGYSTQALILVELRNAGKGWKKVNQKVLATFNNNWVQNTLKPGDRIIFEGEFKPIAAQKNPFDFDYERYLKFKQISERVSIRSSYQQLKNQPAPLKQLALRTRAYLINLYEKSGLESDELQVFSALTLGYKDKLSSELRDAYSGAGAMHVLAVSGLHVGLIYKLLGWLFSFFKIFSRREKISPILILAGIWIYAFITGLSPSVCRSATMFSFILAGIIMGRRSSIYNSIFASAFLLTLLNPYILFDIGFQLSYLAVLGIVFFYPLFRTWVYSRFKPVRFLWDGIAVSFAAQLATLPVCLYYFHQFPVYFWLSGIVVVFFAGILMNASVLLIIASLTGYGVWPAKASALIISTMNHFVQWINTLPGAVISIEWTDGISALLLYAIIGFTSAFFITLKFDYLRNSLIVSLIFILYFNVSYYRSLSTRVMAVYHIPGQQTVHLVNGNKSYWILNDTTLPDNLAKTQKLASRYWKTSSDSTLYFNRLPQEGTWIGNFLISPSGIVNSNLMLINACKRIPKFIPACKEAAVLLTSTPNQLLKPDSLSKITYIFPATVHPFQFQKAENLLTAKPIHYTFRDGAWIKNFPSNQKLAQ